MEDRSYKRYFQALVGADDEIDRSQQSAIKRLFLRFQREFAGEGSSKLWSLATTLVRNNPGKYGALATISGLMDQFDDAWIDANADIVRRAQKAVDLIDKRRANTRKRREQRFKKVHKKEHSKHRGEGVKATPDGQLWRKVQRSGVKVDRPWRNPT